VLHCIAVCRSVLQCVAVCCSVWTSMCLEPHAVVRCSVLKRVAAG